MIDNSLKQFLDTPPLPTRFYAQSARKAAKEIEAVAKSCFKDELLEKAEGVVKALRDYAEELDRD
jgi:hypothetical protein